MHNFKDLKVWNKAMELAKRIYQVTESYPEREKFNLISQMQRAVVSIPSNISEGCGHQTKPALKNYLSIAIGSAYELETQIILSNKLGYFNDETLVELSQKITEVQKMLYGLYNSL